MPRPVIRLGALQRKLYVDPLMARGSGGRLKKVRPFIESLYDHDLHAKRVDSLAGATLSIMTSASLAVVVIGRASAQARGPIAKYAIKQVGPPLGNHYIEVWDSLARWVPHPIVARKKIMVAVDWTEFDRDRRAGKLRGAQVNASPASKVGAVVCVHVRAMKEPRCFATSNAEAPTAMLVNYRAKRRTSEPYFRDTRDPQIGIGLGAVRIREPTRRDRLLLVNAVATVLLTMLGAAGDSRNPAFGIGKRSLGLIQGGGCGGRYADADNLFC